MTAREKLQAAVDELSEADAAEMLHYLERRQAPRDALAELLDNAPLDDELTRPEEEEAVQVARDELARGERVSLDEIRHEFR